MVSQGHMVPNSSHVIALLYCILMMLECSSHSHIHMLDPGEGAVGRKSKQVASL